MTKQINYNYELSTAATVALLRGRNIRIRLNDHETLVLRCEETEIVMSKEEFNRAILDEDLAMLKAVKKAKELPNHTKIIIIDKVGEPQ